MTKEFQNCYWRLSDKACKHRAPSSSAPPPDPGPEAGERHRGLGEQHAVRLSELAVHHGVEHGVDAAVEPGQVCTEHVQHLRRAAALVRYVEQQEGDEAEDEAEENGEAHAGHPFEFAVFRWASGGGGGRRSARGRCSCGGRRDSIS